jgi:hypothetical protein
LKFFRPNYLKKYTYDGENIVIEPNPIFKAVIKNSLSNKKLPRKDYNRTFSIELYKVLNNTSSEIFYKIQGYNNYNASAIFA